MSARPIPFVLVAGLAVLAWAAAAPAQHADPEEAVMDLEFAGGTVSQYVAAIRRKVPGANIVVMPEAAEVTVPPLTLKSVDLATSLSILDDLVEETAMRRIALSVTHRISSTVDGRSIHTVLAGVNDLRQRRPLELQSTVLAVMPILESGMAAENLLQAIETGMELVATSYAPAQIRFHPETGLIIARGHPEQMSLIHEIADQVYDNIWRAQQRTEREQAVAKKDQRIDELTAELQTSHEEILSMTQHAAALEAAREQLNAELAKIRQMLMAREREMTEITARMHQLEAELARRMDDRD